MFNGRPRIAPVLALIAAALAAALVPLPRGFIERWYSTGLYIHIQHAMTRASNLFPFALFDVLIAATLIAWLILAIVDLRRRAVFKIVLRTAIWAAILYLAFLFLWGLNYRRTPLTAKLQFDPQAVSPDAAVAIATSAVDQLNTLHDPAHAMGWVPFGSIDPFLSDAFGRAQRLLGNAAVPARPKRTLLNPFFRLTGVEGMTDPFFLETLLESDLLPFERPMDIAHEWGHLAGFADESEASFLGWLTCIHGSIADQYSGWLFLIEEIVPDLRQKDRSGLMRRIASGPLADLRAMAERRRTRVNPAVSHATERIYDGYLKANRVESGIANYGEVVRLILGVRFGPDWTPLPASQAVGGAPPH